MIDNIWLYLGFILVFVWIFTRAVRTYQSKHAFNIRISKKHLARLQSIPEPAKQMGFLRAVNPYIFEEMILTGLKKKGFSIKRGTSYSGDGGIDGEVKIGGKRVLIQAKRYKNYVSAADILRFGAICEKHRCFGLFIHTGKTGKLSKQNKISSVDIVSGSRLLDMFTNKRFVPHWLSH